MNTLWKNLHLISEASDDFCGKAMAGALPSQVRVAPRIENRDPRGAGPEVLRFRS